MGSILGTVLLSELEIAVLKCFLGMVNTTAPKATRIGGVPIDSRSAAILAASRAMIVLLIAKQNCGLLLLDRRSARSTRG